MFFRLWGKMCNYYDFSPTHPPNISVANGPNLKKILDGKYFPYQAFEMRAVQPVVVNE